MVAVTPWNQLCDDRDFIRQQLKMRGLGWNEARGYLAWKSGDHFMHYAPLAYHRPIARILDSTAAARREQPELAWQYLMQRLALDRPITWAEWAVCCERCAQPTGFWCNKCDEEDCVICTECANAGFACVACEMKAGNDFRKRQLLDCQRFCQLFFVTEPSGVSIPVVMRELSLVPDPGAQRLLHTLTSISDHDGQAEVEELSKRVAAVRTSF